jgi:hypothetical protein
LYSNIENDIWVPQEIESYQCALTKCDKDFFSIAKEVIICSLNNRLLKNFFYRFLLIKILFLFIIKLLTIIN